MKSWQTGNSTTILRILKGRSNVYLITSAEMKIMVDTGGPNRRRSLMRALSQFNIARLDYLILTHTHFDHAGNAGTICEQYNPKVVVHAAEEHILAAGRSVVPRGANVFTKAGVAVGGRRFAALSGFKPCRAAITVEDEYALPQVPGITVIHTPGHSAGSQCVVVDGEYALVGDTMFGMLAGGLYPPFADGPHLMLESWRKLLQTTCHTFLPGHGGPRKRALVQKHLGRRSK